ncbi:MAG: hypothetical protein J6V72_21865 [Kiritimatiellae bacterium]|nr:hypothetical protein [Kiritimatiellia bacterium]
MKSDNAKKWYLSESQYLDGLENLECMDMIVMDRTTGEKYLLCKRSVDVATPPTWCVAFRLPAGGDTLGTVHGELRRRGLSGHIRNIGAIYEPMPWSADDVTAVADSAVRAETSLSVDDYTDKALATFGGKA